MRFVRAAFVRTRPHMKAQSNDFAAHSWLPVRCSRIALGSHLLRRRSQRKSASAPSSSARRRAITDAHSACAEERPAMGGRAGMVHRL
jgi:hypothetical protein